MRRSSGLGVVIAIFASIMSPATAFAAPGPTSVPGAPSGLTASAGVLSATVRWRPAGAAATSFSVASSPGGITATVDGTTTSATLTGLGFGISYTFSVTGTNGVGTGPPSAPSAAVTPDPPGGQYHQGIPRVIFNRDLRARHPIDLGDDPPDQSGMSALVLNVTAGQATVPTSVQLVVDKLTFQTIWVAPGQVESSLAVVAVPATLKHSAVQITAGSAHVQVDFVGYFSGPKSFHDRSGLLKMVKPVTLMDGPVATNSTTEISVLGHGGVPASHVGEVLLNVTATASAGNGALALRPSGGHATGVTTLGFAGGQTTANRAIVAVAASGAVSLVETGAAASVRVEVLGWFTDASDPSAIGSFYTAVGPARLVDTAASGGPLSAGASLSFPVWGQGGTPAAGAVAPPTSALFQVTALAPAGAGSIDMGGVSVLDFAAGQTVSGVELVRLAGDGSASLSVVGAASNVTIDLVAYFSGDLIVPGSTKVLAPDLLAAITNLGADNSITFAAGTQVSPRIRLNDVIVAGVSPTTPNGFLRRVISIKSLPGGETILGTRVARLPEAITAFSIEWVMPPKSGTKAASRPALPPRTAAAATAAPMAGDPFPAPLGTSIDPNFDSFFIAKPPAGLVIDLSKLVFGASELDINDLEVQSLPHFSMSVDPSGNVSLVVGFSVGVRAAIQLQLLGKTSLVDEQLFDHTFLIGLPVVLLVGPVPIVFQPDIRTTVTFGLSLNGGLGVGLNLDRFGALTGGYDGANFFGDAVYHDYLTPDKSFTIQPVVQAQSELDLHLIPGIAFYGGAAAIGAEIKPFLVATVDPFADHWWTVSAGVCRAFKFDLNLILIEKNGVIVPVCVEVTLAQAGRKLDVTLVPTSATVARFRTAHFRAGVAGSTSGVNWTLDEGGPGGSLSNATQTDVDYTAPSRAGTYNLRAAAIDDATSFTEAVITVPAGAPSPPASITATAGPGLALVSWSAPADDGGVPLTGYQVTLSPGGTVLTTDAKATTVTVPGLTPGTAYSFTVTATNSAGLTSGPSVATAPVTILPLGVMSVSPAAIDFGQLALGQASPPQTVQVFADGLVRLAVTGVALGGTSPGDFAIQSDQCSGKTVPAGGSCSFAVVFKPTSQGSAGAVVAVADSDPTSPQLVTLTGSSPVPVTAGIRPIGDIQMLDPQRGYMVEGGGRTNYPSGVMATIDGGRTWALQQAPADVFINTTGVRFVDATHGWVLACRPTLLTCPTVVVGTTDGGQTWHDLGAMPDTVHVQRFWFSDLQHGWMIGSTYVPAPPGWPQGSVVSRNALYATLDGGVTWSSQTLPDPVAAGCPLLDESNSGVRFADSLHGWAVGESYCYASTAPFGFIGQSVLVWTTSDGGLNWTAHAMPPSIDFPHGSRLQVPTASQMRIAARFTPDPHTSEEVLISSDDAGATFNFPLLPGGVFGPPSDVQFTDASHGVMVGFDGGFWRTADGGNTWVRAGTLPSVQDPTGSISFIRYQRVDAVDANNIWVVGWVIYGGGNQTAGLVERTSDGGATWTTQLLGDGT